MRRTVVLSFISTIMLSSAPAFSQTLVSALPAPAQPGSQSALTLQLAAQPNGETPLMPPSAAPPANPSFFSGWGLELAPRLWFRMNNSNVNNGSQGSLNFIMYGLAATISPPFLQGGAHPTDIVFTGYGGPFDSNSLSLKLLRSAQRRSLGL